MYSVQASFLCSSLPPLQSHTTAVSSLKAPPVETRCAAQRQTSASGSSVWLLTFYSVVQTQSGRTDLCEILKSTSPALNELGAGKCSLSLLLDRSKLGATAERGVPNASDATFDRNSPASFSFGCLFFRRFALVYGSLSVRSSVRPRGCLAGWPAFIPVRRPNGYPCDDPFDRITSQRKPRGRNRADHPLRSNTRPDFGIESTSFS